MLASPTAAEVAKGDGQVFAWKLLQDHCGTKCKFFYLEGSGMDLNLTSS